MRKQPRLNINFEDDYDELEVEKDDDIEIEDDIVEECDNNDYAVDALKKSRKKNDDFGVKLNSYRKNRNRKRRHKKLKHIISFMFVAILLTVLGVCVWNALQMTKTTELVNTIDDTFTQQETGITNVQRLGKLLTIHDSKSYDWVMSNIEMTPALKRSLFTPNDDGSYSFKGTPVSDELAPTYELVEVQYENSDNPLSYLAVFNVTRQDKTVMSYFVTCEFRGNTLTAFHIY